VVGQSGRCGAGIGAIDEIVAISLDIRPEACDLFAN
jgi:hypothetical protein